MYDKILVPLDGSENAEKILRHVKEIATGCRASEVIVIDVIEPVYYDQSLLGISGSAMKDIRDSTLAVEQKYIDAVTQQLREDGINAYGVVEMGRPADAIIDYAEQNKVDLIMLCTHGRSGVSRWIFGSVAERILQNAAVPVFMLSLRKMKN
jgi:nucleotide-binding universal stress UspA family protein